MSKSNGCRPPKGECVCAALKSPEAGARRRSLIAAPLLPSYPCLLCSMPGGESGADVLDRISSFFVTLFRFFQESDDCGPDTTVIIVSHGLTSRLFLSRFFHWSVETFEETLNLPNAGYVQMDRAERAAPPAVKGTTMPTEAGGARRGFCFRLTADSVALLGLSDAKAHGRGGTDAAACVPASSAPTLGCGTLPSTGACQERATV